MDHVPGPMGVRHDRDQRVADLVQVGNLRRQPVEGGGGVRDNGGQRLVRFVSDRRDELASCHATDVRQLGLGLAYRVLGQLALDELAYLASDGLHQGQ